MAQCRCEASEGAKADLRPVGNADEAGLLSAAHHNAFALGGKRCGDAVDQPLARVERLRLVAAEPPRLSACQDRAEEFQSNASVALPSAL